MTTGKKRSMSRMADWQTVYDFWFPPGLADDDFDAHRNRFGWWFGGGSHAELLAFAPLLEAGRDGRLDDWLTPRSDARP